MEYDDILFVIPTAKELGDVTKLKGPSQKLYLCNNKKFLLQALLSARDTKLYIDSSAKYIICMHDDLWILDDKFNEKVSWAFNNYDYWGIAGTNAMSVDNPRWHVTPQGNKKKNFGFVEHNSDGQRFVTSFGSYPNEAVVVDGLFMAFKRELFDRFLEDTAYDGFHMYDMELCTQAFAMGYKGGVQGIYTYHESRGDSINTKEWSRLANVYKNKWFSKYKIISRW